MTTSRPGQEKLRWCSISHINGVCGCWMGTHCSHLSILSRRFDSLASRLGYTTIFITPPFDSTRPLPRCLFFKSPPGSALGATRNSLFIGSFLRSESLSGLSTKYPLYRLTRESATLPRAICLKQNTSFLSNLGFIC